MDPMEEEENIPAEALQHQPSEVDLGRFEDVEQPGINEPDDEQGWYEDRVHSEHEVGMVPQATRSRDISTIAHSTSKSGATIPRSLFVRPPLGKSSTTQRGASGTISHRGYAPYEASSSSSGPRLVSRVLGPKVGSYAPPLSTSGPVRGAEIRENIAARAPPTPLRQKAPMTPKAAPAKPKPTPKGSVAVRRRREESPESPVRRPRINLAVAACLISEIHETAVRELTTKENIIGVEEISPDVFDSIDSWGWPMTISQSWDTLTMVSDPMCSIPVMLECCLLTQKQRKRHEEVPVREQGPSFDKAKQEEIGGYISTGSVKQKRITDIPKSEQLIPMRFVCI